jgi:hypothetical protein
MESHGEYFGGISNFRKKIRNTPIIKNQKNNDSKGKDTEKRS